MQLATADYYAAEQAARDRARELRRLRLDIIKGYEVQKGEYIELTPEELEATRVLVKGEPVTAPPGRADDFVWPLGSDIKFAQPVAVAPPRAAQPNSVPAAASGALASVPAEKRQEERKSHNAKLTQKTITKPSRPEVAPRSPTHNVPGPPLPISPTSGLFRGKHNARNYWPAWR